MMVARLQIPSTTRVAVLPGGKQQGLEDNACRLWSRRVTVYARIKVVEHGYGHAQCDAKQVVAGRSEILNLARVDCAAIVGVGWTATAIHRVWRGDDGDLALADFNDAHW